MLSLLPHSPQSRNLTRNIQQGGGVYRAVAKSPQVYKGKPRSYLINFKICKDLLNDNFLLNIDLDM